jgi:hypothetical protein
MSSHKNIELREKAKNYVIEKKWDMLLCHAYLETQYFSTWVKNQENFEEEVNIGLKNISSENILLECSYVKESTDFLVASFNETYFKIGGCRNSDVMPDGDMFSTLCINLFINEKLVLSIMYSDDTLDGYFAKDYRMISVEEMHSSPEISTLLEGIAESIEKKEKRAEQEKQQTQNQTYEGKFTFGD